MKAFIGCNARSPTEVSDTGHGAPVGFERVTDIQTHIDQKQWTHQERYNKTRRDATKYHDGD